MRKLFIISTFLLLFATSCTTTKGDDSSHIYIIATNDMHANIYSMPQLATLIDEYEQLGEVLVVDAGDRISGNAFIDDNPRQGIPLPYRSRCRNTAHRNSFPGGSVRG